MSLSLYWLIAKLKFSRVRFQLVTQVVKQALRFDSSEIWTSTEQNRKINCWGSGLLFCRDCSWHIVVEFFMFRCCLRHLLLFLLLKWQSLAKRNARGDLVNSKPTLLLSETHKIWNRNMLPGPTLMPMSTGLAYGPVTHAHYHFCIRRRDVYLVMHYLHIYNSCSWYGE